MVARDRGENHRPATPLELLYDLCFVVAIAQAAHGLLHSVSHGHFADGTLAYVMVFCTIWWAWMGFTWFASSFDNDDTIYRLKVLLQMVGVLILAAGIPMAMESGDYKFITIGYAVMRVGLIAQWLRAGKSEPKFRSTAHRYVIGILVCQAGWFALLAAPASLWLIGFGVLVIMELLVPVWAEAARKTQWHPDHIAERYGLLTIIVIGESVLAAITAIQAALTGGSPSAALIATIVSAPIILFSMWWLYFLIEPDHGGESGKRSFIWGYLHYFVFMSAAAVGVGISVNVGYAMHTAHISATAAGMSIAIPVAIYLACLYVMGSKKSWPLPTAMTACMLAPLCPFSPLIIAAILFAVTAVIVRSNHCGGAPNK